MKPSAIRPARSADLEAVLAIEASWATTPGWSRGQFEDEFSTAKSLFFVLEEDGAVLGYFVARRVVDEVQLLDIAVAPEAARRGLGRRLLGRLVEEGRALGCSKIALEVSERNAAARRLYEAAGCRIVGRRPKFYADGSGAILMDLPCPLRRSI